MSSELFCKKLLGAFQKLNKPHDLTNYDAKYFTKSAFQSLLNFFYKMLANMK
jgi:hypothetical protein